MPLLLVLYYSVLGATMVAYVDAHRVSMRNTTTVPVLHMPNQLNVQNGVVPVQLCAQLPAHERHRPGAHEPAADATWTRRSMTTHARCVEQWRGMVPGDVQKQCALPWPPGCASERVRAQMDEHSTWRCF